MAKSKVTTERREVRGKVRMELQDFKYVKGAVAGRMLRFSVTQSIEFDDGKIHAVSLAGCTIRRNPEGELQFQAPVTRNGVLFIHTVLLSPDFVQTILDIIGKSKYAKDIGTGLDYQKQPELMADPVIEVI